MMQRAHTANEAFVLQAAQAMLAGDAETFFDAFADDVLIVEPASLPYGGTHRGRDAFRRIFAELHRLWVDWDVAIEDVASHDDRVYLMIRFEATARATGKRVAFPIVEVWRVVDGRALSLQPIYGDTALALNALGVAARDQEGRSACAFGAGAGSELQTKV